MLLSASTALFPGIYVERARADERRGCCEARLASETVKGFA